ncbi:U3 small nucleolar ribonucleoprotein imp4, partial [Biomphalaria glabrata]
STDSDYTSDVSDEDDSDDSDKTFILPENRKDNDELASWLTLQDSEHLEKEKASLLIELSELQKDTSLTDPHEKILSWLDKANTSLEYIDFKPSPLSVPVTQTTNSGSPYNLRPRKQTNSPSISPVTRVESAKSFSKTVYHMHQIAEKNSRLVRALHSTSPGATVSPQTLVLDDRS